MTLYPLAVQQLHDAEVFVTPMVTYSDFSFPATQNGFPRVTQSSIASSVFEHDPHVVRSMPCVC